MRVINDKLFEIYLNIIIILFWDGTDLRVIRFGIESINQLYREENILVRDGIYLL